VWFFSSGPLDDSSDREEISPTLQVQTLMERVGAIGHVTFGGRLTSDAHGFPANAMAKKRSGDWRNLSRIRAWAAEIARLLPTARPGPVVEQPGGSIVRLVAHASVGWAACAALTGVLLQMFKAGVALGLHAVAVPVVFALVAQRYFRPRGARSAMSTALAFVAIVALLDLIIVAGLVQRNLAMFGSVIGTWVPFSLILAVTWLTGESSSPLAGVVSGTNGSERLKIVHQLPPPLGGQPRPGWHAASQVAVREEPEQGTGRRGLHMRGPQARCVVAALCIRVVTLGAVLPEQFRAGPRGVRPPGVRIGA
jgi:hypothetical protein